jgi:hypothetical protein
MAELLELVRAILSVINQFPRLRPEGYVLDSSTLAADASPLDRGVLPLNDAVTAIMAGNLRLLARSTDDLLRAKKWTYGDMDRPM